jgi:hypothetical protein
MRGSDGMLAATARLNDGPTVPALRPFTAVLPPRRYGPGKLAELELPSDGRRR